MSDRLRRLEPGAERTAAELVAGLDLRAAPGPRVAAAMIASTDGRATVQGRSVALGHPADRALLRTLRAGVDAILVGSATLRAEHYRNLLDADQRAARVAAGLPEHPIVVTVSRTLDLPLEIGLFGEAGRPIIVATESQDPAPAVAADLTLMRFPKGTLSLAEVLDGLRDLHDVRAVSCEGGPSLLRRLVVEGRLDDLLLTVAPLLVAGDAATILEGPAFDDPPRLELRDVHRADDHLFLHYAVAR